MILPLPVLVIIMENQNRHHKCQRQMRVCPRRAVRAGAAVVRGLEHVDAGRDGLLRDLVGAVLRAGG